jgi:serine/threonine protein kinase
MLHARQRLGDFEIVRSLGKGGMGEVYEAQQENPSRRVALKVLTGYLSDNADAIKHFHRETDILARLDHPGIIRIFTTGITDDGTFYYTMQLVRGVTLARLLKDASVRHEPIPFGQATLSGNDAESVPANRATASRVEMAAAESTPFDLLRGYREDRYALAHRAGIAVAEALSAAHHERVLHRDVKPGNVMIDQRGHFYLMDFGLARLLHAVDGTQSGVIKGTPWYMSPEQARGEPLDERSDVYSLGITLYELATGGVGPFAVGRSNHEEVLCEVRAGQLRPLRDLAPDIPLHLANVIDRATRFRAEHRFPTAAAMHAVLTRTPPVEIHQPAPVEVRRPAPVVAVREASTRLAPRRWKRWFGWGGLVVAFVVTASFFWTTAPSTAPHVTQEFPWPQNPLPETRVRKPREPIPLLRTRPLEPIWFQRLWGDDPCFHAQPTQLMMHSLGNQPTLALLDYDPQWHDYEFEITLVRLESPDPAKNRLGVVLGYHRYAKDPTRHDPFLAIELQEVAPPGQEPGLHLGTLYLEEPRDGIDGVLRSFKPLPDTFNFIKLPAPDRARDGRRLHVWASADNLGIQVVGSTQRHDLNLRQVRAAMKPPANELDPRGGVGVWTAGGIGFFRDASVTPLSSPVPKP